MMSYECERGEPPILRFLIYVTRCWSTYSLGLRCLRGLAKAEPGKKGYELAALGTRPIEGTEPGF